MTMPDEPDMIAAELALGVLEGEERAAAVRRVLTDPAFAREVEDWRDRLAALHGEWPDAAPSEIANRRAVAIPTSDATGLRRWRWTAAIAGVAAAILLIVTVQDREPEVRVPINPASAAPTLLAVLKPTGSNSIGATINLASREVRFGGPLPVPGDRVAELWVIRGDGVPHAVGLVQQNRALLTPGTPIAAGDTLAISIERPGGSAKSTPTGPVIATGALVQA